VLGVIGFDRDLETAVRAPRIHDQGIPAVLLVEPDIPAAIRDRLAAVQCHQLKVMPDLGAVSAVGLANDGTPHAAGDPRKDGGAVVMR
jgi:gamma-glutamyltranspeptidase